MCKRLPRLRKQVPQQRHLECRSTVFQDHPEAGGNGGEYTPQLPRVDKHQVWQGLLRTPEDLRTGFQSTLSSQQPWEAKVQSRFLCGTVQFKRTRS